MEKGVNRSDWFNVACDKSGAFPVHFAPSHSNSKIHRVIVPGDRSQGKRPNHGLLVHWKGLSEGHFHGYNYFPTKFDGGFYYNAICIAGENRAPTVTLILELNGAYVHDVKKSIERCVGSAHEYEREKVSTERLDRGFTPQVTQ